jgi:phosphate transport system ATP-binding protein
VTPSGHDESGVPLQGGSADQATEAADPVSEFPQHPDELRSAVGEPSEPVGSPVNSAGGPVRLAGEPSDLVGSPVNSAGGPVSPAGEPSGSGGESAEPPEPGPASPSTSVMAGFARQEGWVVGLPDGQAPQTARLPAAAPWPEPAHTPAAGSHPGGARQDAPAISVSDYRDHQPPAGQYPGGNGAGGRLPDLGPLMDLETRDLAAWFGSHKVLEGVSLKMEAGAVTALIGPSGCGKSTFLRILNRMHELVRSAALAGEVLLGGEDIYDPRQRPADVRRRIGMVFQKPNPFPAMSIYENVASGLKLAGIKVRNRDELVQTSLQRAGLWNEVRKRLRTPGGALSGGQQQRLCIARSLAVSPEVLLMDEPCSALDPTSTRRIEETIRELAGHVTIVIVTHNMQQAQRVSSNCAFFLAAENTPGHIVESGPTEQLFEDPVDPRTASYVHGQFG